MYGLAWFDEVFSIRVAQTLLHFLWQGAAIGLLAWMADWALVRAPARSKYLLHVTALVVLAACLPVTFAWLDSASSIDRDGSVARRDTSQPGAAASREAMLADGARVSDVQARARLAPSGDPTNATAPGVERISQTPVIPPAGNRTAELPRPAPHEAGATPVESLTSTFTACAPYLTVMYLLCVLAMLARMTTAIWGGHRLRSSSVAVDDAALLKAVARQAHRFGMRAAPAIAFCQRVSIPVVVGVLRPMILLPTSVASGLSPQQLETLFTHELAHLCRHDPLLNLVQRFVEAIAFFHPAVWYISHRIDVERENACDDMVLAAGYDRIHYADALVQMAELSSLLRAGQTRAGATLLAASGSGNSEFQRRVIRLIEGRPAKVRLTPTGFVFFLTIIAATVIMPIVMQGRAENTSDQVADKEPSAPQQRQAIGQRISGFQLQDYLGRQHALDDFADHDVVVIAFLGAECPLAKLYASRLQVIAEEYATRLVTILGINSNQQDTPTELGHFVRRHHIGFPMLKDPGNRVADQFQAERTPEVFVLDRERSVRYRGRIDDQFGVGYSRPEPKQHYLTIAIDELLAGEPISRPQTESVGCYIGRVNRKSPSGNVTYTQHVATIVQQRCVECHRDGGIAPFALESYDAVSAWAETIREVVEDQRMPPWHADPRYGHFANDARMPAAEKDLLYEWVENGVPRGPAADLPPRRQFDDGWALGQPDLLLTLPEAIVVPPTGVVDYQYVTVDPGFTEGKWIRASEIRPGVRSVVHHIAVFINPPGGDPILEERGIGFETVGGYVPGCAPMELQEGTARYVPAGSTFVFQIHYTPDGTRREDRSQIGLYFANPSSVGRTMQTGVAANLNLEIPPHADSYHVEAAHRFSHDMELHALAPHMHYRGKSFRFEATYPNGSREILLNVPRYDFNWQHSYRFAKPKFVPEGTLLRCVAHFDNSVDNLSNPDPTVAVRWGEQTWEEMMIGYFEGVFLNQDLSLQEPQLTRRDDGAYRVRFAFRPDRPADTVNVAGTFNEWNHQSHPLQDPDGDGVYAADVVVDEGEYNYKFVINGTYWTHDPASRILTGFLHNSVFVTGDLATP